MITSKSLGPKNKDRDFFLVKESSIHGMGLFAKTNIPKGTRIIEYTGERVPLTNLLTDNHENESNKVYFFYLTQRTVIDGSRNGNEARFANHSCDPNCETYNFDDRIFLYAMRDIIQGEELTYDYHLKPALRVAGKKFKKKDYPCNCGSTNCRGTILAVRKKSKSI